MFSEDEGRGGEAEQAPIKHYFNLCIKTFISEADGRQHSGLMKFTIKKPWRLFSGFLIVLSKSPMVWILELSGLIADSTEWF